jgi:four helix bundle protein
MANYSAFELETQLILADDLNFIKSEELKNILNSVQEVQKMIFGFSRTLKNNH